MSDLRGSIGGVQRSSIYSNVKSDYSNNPENDPAMKVLA